MYAPGIDLGGGAQSPIWRQILADALDVTLIQKQTTNDSPFGAALMAGTAVRLFESLEAPDPIYHE